MLDVTAQVKYLNNLHSAYNRWFIFKSMQLYLNVALLRLSAPSYLNEMSTGVFFTEISWCILSPLAWNLEWIF